MFNGSFSPSKPLQFVDKKLCVFEYSPPKEDKDGFVLLPQVPYEVKEHALKGFLYTFFLTWAGRAFAVFLNSVPAFTILPFYTASVFLYQYGKSINYFLHAITKIELKDDGETVIFTYKYLPKEEVKICNIIKKKEENFFAETYSEPFLYPIQVNYTHLHGKHSLRSHRTYYLYGDSYENIKQGELLRAILNNKTINV